MMLHRLSPVPTRRATAALRSALAGIALAWLPIAGAAAQAPQAPATTAPAPAPAPAPVAAERAQPALDPSPTLEAIRARGHVLCGVHAGLPGFAAADAEGRWSGFEVDLCRAVAIAIFGAEEDRLRFVPLTAEARFAALRAGEVDMLMRGTALTFGRDVTLGLDFPLVTFHDGQGFMLRAALGLENAAQLDGARICVQAGTDGQAILAEWAAENRLNIRSVAIERLEATVQAYAGNRCDAISAPIATLAAMRALLPEPAAHRILPQVISIEPQGPALRQDDPRFADLVRWVLLGLIAAEELGITAAEAAAMRENDPRPAVRRLLGAENGFGPALGLDTGVMLAVLTRLGNYGEIYERNLAPLGLQRGRNALWTQPGGLMFAPPLR